MSIKFRPNPFPLILVGLLTLTFCPLGSAQDSRPAETQPAATQPAESQPASAPTTTRATTQSQPTTTTSKTTADEKEKERWFAVINARVHTITGPDLDNATILAKDGVITAIGTDITIPDECQVIDAAGKDLYPGLVAAQSDGIFRGSNPADSTDLFSLNMTIALAGGITTAGTGDKAAKLTFGTTEDMLLTTRDTVRISYSRRSPLARAELRNDLQRVRDYLRDLDKYQLEKQHDDDAEAPDKDWLKGKYKNYQKLLERQAVARASANQMQDLRDLADLARHFGFDLIIEGAYEGWIVADELGRANVSAIITPRIGAGYGGDILPDKRLNRPSGTTIENAYRLHQHGVPLAVIPLMPRIILWGLAGQDLLHLNMEAAFTVRGGMSNEAALKTITIDAARLLGVDDRVGSLEVGKDADLVICDGDILHYMTQVHYTIVNGRVAYDKSKESLFAHIRPSGEPEPTQFDDHWPRPLEWPD